MLQKNSEPISKERILEREYLFGWDGLDSIPTDERKKLIFALFKRQFSHNKSEVPFYSRRYKNIGEDDLTEWEDCVQKVPTLRKEDIRALASPYDLLDEGTAHNLASIYLHRGTGGTTGEPTSMFFTKNDWEAVLSAMTRAVGEVHTLKKPIVAYDGYNQGHISGPIFDDTIRKLGGLPISRNFGCSDEQALLQMKRHKCNLIIAPPVSTHKGGSIQNLLDADSKLGLNYINGKNIDVIFCSSTNLTPELHRELKDLGIKYIYNYYGSTDVLPTAISCQENPFDLHVLFGHVALFVVDEEQHHVSNGKRGLVISSRIGSYDDKYRPSVSRGTQLLNYHVGDEVTYLEDQCPCGRTTPRIRDVKRVADIQDKLEGGCEQW